MGTRKKCKKAILATIPFLIILIIAFSCKKDIQDPDPAEPWTPPIPTQPNVFSNRTLYLMSKSEIANKQEFPGLRLYRTGTILKGEGKEIFENFGEIGDLLWEMADYKITEGRFDKIDEEIDGLSKQIDQLDARVHDMQEELKIGFDDLTNHINSLNIKTYIDPIRNQMDSSSYSQFGYYQKIASDYQKHPSPVNDSRMADANLTLGGYVDGVMKDNNATSMNMCITSLFTSICPDKEKLSTDNVIHDYAVTLVDKCKGKINDSADAMAAYIMLESFFLTLVNYQYRAAIIMVNATNYDYITRHPNDTSGIAGKEYWKNRIGAIIPWETRIFQDNVDFLLTNLSEYRNENRFVSDMQYANVGLAPDSIFFHAFARSQFVSNLLNASSGNTYPVISGHIMIPNRYSDDGTPIDIKIPLNIQIGSVNATTTANTFATVIPYTYWDSKQICHPDNNWNVYRFNSPVSGSGWPGTPQTIQVVTNGPTSPWPHSGDIKGNVTPLYYNLADLSKPSTTKTDECNFQFGYVSANWQWGYLLLSNTSLQTTLPGEFNLNNYTDYEVADNPPSVPFSVEARLYTPGSLSEKEHYHILQDITKSSVFEAPNDYSGALTYKTTVPNYSETYFIVDSRYLSVHTGSEKLANSSLSGNNSIEAWTSYNGVINDMEGKITISIGTHLNSDDGCHYAVGDLIKDTFKNKGVNYSFPLHFAKAELSRGTSYKPGFQYMGQIIGQNDIDIRLSHSYQFIYTGLY